MSVFGHKEGQRGIAVTYTDAKRDNIGRFMTVVPRAAVLECVDAILAESAAPLRVGEIHREMAAHGASLMALSTFRDHIRQAIKTGEISPHQIIDGRRDNRGTSATKRHKQQFKFKVGDKVRINTNPDNSGRIRTPQWLRQLIRTDTPRTVISIYRIPWREGIWASRYYLGTNRGGTPLGDYPFRPGELIFFIKGNIGRPKLKRAYNQKNGNGGTSVLIDYDKKPLVDLVVSPSISCVNCICETAIST